MRSSTKRKAESPVQPRTGWLVVVRLLSVIGLALSAYLLWGSLAHGSLPGCGAESGCDAVLRSRWATWFGFPVSGFALLLYVALLGGLWKLQYSSEAIRHRVWPALMAGAAALAAAAVWFIGLQLFAIRAICPFCMA